MRSIFRLKHINSSPLRLCKREFSNSSLLYKTFQEGDVVILRHKRDAANEGTLVRLKSGNVLHTHRGAVEHASIIGKSPRQLVNSSKGYPLRLHDPTLAEYVRLTPRIVTPIYPHDANLIVSLLDIHVDTPSGSSHDAPLEILEAGTGHGALTLHLSRAVHAANSASPKPPPFITSREEPEAQESEDDVHLGESISDLQDANFESWKAGRRAIVHTLDISSKHSKFARKIVKGFRQGMYACNVDFHVGDVSAWIDSQKSARGDQGPFLSHVFLDLPNAHDHLASVATVLHVNGLLAVFNPSITQILECVEIIRKNRLPYLLDQVIELGAGNIRQWDVRSVKPRATLKKPGQSPKESEVQSGLRPSDDSSTDAMEGQSTRDDELDEAFEEPGEDSQVIVCRPKVGERVVGGGFLALWKRMEPPSHDSYSPSSHEDSS
ncbi:S-adenosyl-L-methionine-dependent methyltransferase [Aaosphaeria arxii CBS 175.79]|uniref:tRNA (adenine(58)-N(1))-methyltransferase catalytic subunit TRM61 n=1 Tax=Aaosphaeria arxii CBS 175.79 TaxID=1450172 RepID=A0A6A5YAX1_9PLEO|nr:S-adenosyl-L-methionine-dependent methyltransferase [Aaosphaeria arxii CBS 175.79]KAF2021841.1 S-adenosyl-L-methionine-dependent methyltransferase [Aaosphaeria arxii CBS 175.79]